MKYFKVTVSSGVVGSDQSVVIGPYTDDELDEYGQPQSEDIEMAAWEMIDCGVDEISQEEAEENGYI